MHFLARSPRRRPHQEKDEFVRARILHSEPICRRYEQRVARSHRGRLFGAGSWGMQMEDARALAEVPDLLIRSVVDLVRSLVLPHSALGEAQLLGALQLIDKIADLDTIGCKAYRALAPDRLWAWGSSCSEGCRDRSLEH
jgi:hypothetical protein